MLSSLAAMASERAGNLAAVLADAKHRVAVVSTRRAAPVNVAGLPEGNLNVRGDAAQLPLRPYDGRDGWVVPAVLDGNEGAIILYVPFDEVGGPLGVVRLDGDEGIVEGFGDVLGLGQMHGVDRDGEVALTAAGAQTLGAHLFDVGGPHVDERDVVFAGLNEECANVAAHGARAHDYDAVCHCVHLLGKFSGIALHFYRGRAVLSMPPHCDWARD